MTDLCKWSYQRDHYLALNLDNGVPVNGYYSPGSDVSEGSEILSKLTELYGYINIVEIGTTDDLRHVVINNDDSVKDTVQKLEILTKYRSECFYLFCDTARPQNMLHGYLYNLSSTEVRPFKYNQYIFDPGSFKESFRSDEDWEKHANVINFETSLMSSYQYEKMQVDLEDGRTIEINILYYVTIDTYLKFLHESFNSTKDTVYTSNKFQIKTYYPDMDPVTLKTFGGNTFQSRIMHEENSVAFGDLFSAVLKGSYTINLVNSNIINTVPTEGIEFYNCNILEAVVHINYGLDKGAFVDVEKVFKMFPVTEEWPFSRLRTDKETSYYVHQSLTDPNSDGFMDMKTISGWINPTISKIIDRNDIHAVQKAITEHNISKGVSFKMLNYINSDGVRKYMTLNIYKDGKLELKCSWDENFSADGSANNPVNTNPGGNLELLRDAIAKVHKFITKLNMLQYHIKAAKIQKIPPPDLSPETGLPDLNDQSSNTNIVFMNTVTIFNLNNQLNFESLADFSDHFNSYAHRVNNYLDDKTVDHRSLEMRYTRINNYIRLKSLHEHIKNYKDHNKDNYQSARLVSDMIRIHGLSDQAAKMALADYEKKYEGHKKKNQRKFLTADMMSKTLGRKIDKQTGVHMKILKIQPKNPQDYHYKCLVLGVSRETQNSIYHFLKTMIMIFSNIEMYIGQDPDFLSMMLGKNVVANEQLSIIQHMQQITVEAQESKQEQEQEQEQEQAYDQNENDGEDVDYGDTNVVEDDESDGGEQSTQEEEKSVSKEPPKATIVLSGRSFLDILKSYDNGRYAEFYATYDGNYSTLAQPNAAAQPMVVTPQHAEKLKKFVNEEILKLQEEIAKESDVEVLEYLNQKLADLRQNKLSLDMGHVFRYKNFAPGFFFCPYTWDTALNGTEDVDTAFPMHSEVDDLNKIDGVKSTNPRFYKSRSNKPKPHLNFKEKSGICYPLCHGKPMKDDIRKKCVEGIALTSESSGTANITYVMAEGKYPSPNRYAFINSLLNNIFNHDDSGKKLNKNTMISGFDYYLRRGYENHNSFLNVIGAACEVQNPIDNIINFLADETSVEIFRSLKKGALNQIFLPSTDNPEELQNALEETAIVVDRFITYLQERSDELNEDFLWDLVTKPGCFLPQGFNLIICDISLVKVKGKSKREIGASVIKCPIGFDINTLFNTSLPTLVIYKFIGKNMAIYETITRVIHDGKLFEKTMFDANDPLTSAIIDHIRSKCIILPNLEAEKELQKHIRNVGNDHLMQTFLLNDNEPITSHVAKQLLVATDAFTLISQATDHYNKVTYLVVARRDDTSEPLVLPVIPSGLLPSVPIVGVNDLPLPDLLSTIRLLVELASFDNFVGYAPYAFMLDPGDDLDDPNDDVILGLILSNGLIVNTTPIKVVALDEMDNTILRIRYRDPDVEMEEIEFNIRTLLFAEEDRMQLWYDDYLEADKQLGKVNTIVNDKRMVYSVRSDFENETYQRLRYELMRYIDSYPSREIADSIEEIAVGNDNINTKRQQLKNMLTPIIYDLIVSEADGGWEKLTESQLAEVEKAIGSLGKGYDEMTDEDYNNPNHRYTYIKPVIRYECYNEALDSYRGTDPHCVNHKLFVPSTNLLTGARNNIENYISRVVEEIIRIPLKRRELIYNEMNNFVTDVHSVTDAAYHLTKNNDIAENLKTIYTKTVNYLNRLKENYDSINPDSFNTDTSHNESTSNCIKSFRNMPSHWLKKIGNMSLKYVEINGPENCIYTELDNVIASGSPGQDIDTRKGIADLINSDQFTSYDARQAWEMARDHYQRLWPDAYHHIRSKEDFLRVVSKSDRHHLQIHDLSLISRVFNVKFIILSEPNQLTTNGIVCLQTTQTVVGQFIILYQSTINRFHIVKDVTESPPRGLFTAAQLPELIFKEWIETCISDSKSVIDPANHIFALAPVLPVIKVPAKPKTTKIDASLVNAPKFNLSSLILPPGKTTIVNVPIVPTIPTIPSIPSIPSISSIPAVPTASNLPRTDNPSKPVVKVKPIPKPLATTMASTSTSSVPEIPPPTSAPAMPAPSTTLKPLRIHPVPKAKPNPDTSKPPNPVVKVRPKPASSALSGPPPPFVPGAPPIKVKPSIPKKKGPTNIPDKLE